MTQRVALSEELLHTMRTAAQKAIELREPFITPRAILLALLDDDRIGPVLSGVVDRDRVIAAQIEPNYGVARIAEDLENGEEPAMTRYDTLAFKTPDGRASMWLCRDAYNIFLEGVRRAGEHYQPKHLAFGLAAQAVLAPNVLAAVRVEPGIVADALYKV